MAEKEAKEEKPSSAPPADSAPKDGKKAGKGGLLKSTPAMLVIIMFLEAIVLFAGFKFLGSGAKHAEAVTPESEVVDGGAAPAGSHGEAPSGGGGASHANAKQMVEIPVLSFKAPNRVSGVTYLYEVEVVATAKSTNKDKVTASIEGRTATIKDRVRTIISQSEPAKLGGGSEPGLETLRRQIKFQLDEIVGPHLIEEVLIPRCIPYRADY